MNSFVIGIWLGATSILSLQYVFKWVLFEVNKLKSKY